MAGVINPIMDLRLPQAAVESFENARSEGAYKDLEGLFVNLLLKEMRQSVPDDGLFERSHATKIYEEMLDEVFSRAIAESGQLGLAQQFAEQIRVQELHRDLRASEAAMEVRALEPLK